MKIVIDIPEDVLKRTVFYREFKDLNDCITTIKALEKAITLPEHHGEWLDKKMTIKGGHGLAYGRYGCSVCKKKQPSKSDFCPNCGADMREVQDEDSD